MKLPNGKNAVVPPAKIILYLLSVTHSDGRHKARFFTQFGFSVSEWERLASALIQHATAHSVVKEEVSPFGVRFVVDGIIHSPDGRNPDVRTVWFVETVGSAPYFVTAYPLKECA